MSPLARSLLALAALLAAADAMSNPFCDHDMIGETSDRPITFRKTVTGGEMFSVDNRCAFPGSELAGESFDVCNVYSKPKVRIAIGMLEIQTPFPVIVECPKDVPGCSSLDVQVTQYCRGAKNSLPPGYSY
ncbi:uncharacterized protein LOC125227641 [Leguminivora glycinivorella]|uniref:uncharacterized protein LOC125227641 n=1 Tax=Leguminivora glycinivorella TaxID=1035111 RepID=UPI00200E48AE|nr:uncharacterized protein LOC125227641 [Leguminivora glycinivorella]